MATTISDYLLQATGGVTNPRAGVWVKFTNTLSNSTLFISTAITDVNGLYTINNVTPGSYIVATGITNTGPWINTGDNNYVVADNLGYFDVKTYGAKGDGTTDDTIAIQAAITAAQGGGGVVFLPTGTYKVTSTLATHNNISVLGSGWTSVLTSTAANPVIQMVGDQVDSAHEGHGSYYSNFRVDGGAIGNGLRGMDIGAYVNSTTIRASYISSIWFTRCAIGLQFVNTQGFGVRDCKFGGTTGGSSFACAIGCRISDNSEIGTFINCDFRANTGTSLLMDDSGPMSGGALNQGIYMWTFIQCHFESNVGKCVDMNGATYNTFIMCKYEQNATDYITLRNTGTRRCDGNMFIGGTYNGNTPTPGIFFVNLQQAAGTLFIGGFFNPGFNAGINIGAGAFQTTFENVTLNCAVTDAGGNTSYSDPINGRFARPRSTVTVAYAANLTIDASLGEFFYIALTGNTVVQIPTAFSRPGQRVTLQFGQNSPGGWTVGWIATGNGSWRQVWSDTGNVTGKHSTISFVYNEALARWIQDAAQGPYC